MEKKTATPVQYVTIEAEYAGQRIDNFLITRLKSVPKTHIYRILRKGEVRVNKKRAKPDYRLQENDQVRLPPLKLDLPAKPLPPRQQLVEELTDRILYEDKNLLIVNKPSGIAVHGGSGIRMGVIETLRCMFPKLVHLELAHRLDLETSGCLILAKKRSILREIHELLRAGQVSKIYWALTKGHWKSSECHVAVSLKKNFLKSGERIVRVDHEGKQSLTIFKPLEVFKEATLVEAVLKTGRTHQIRVHAQYKKHPIAQDEKYGDKEFNKAMRQYGVKRLFLHAHFIELTLPSTGQTIRASAPLDAELVQSLKNLKK